MGGHIDEALDNTKKATKKRSRQPSKEIRLELFDLKRRVAELEKHPYVITYYPLYQQPPVQQPFIVTSNTQEA